MKNKKMYFVSGNDIYATKKYIKEYINRKKIYILDKSNLSNLDYSLKCKFNFGCVCPINFIYDVNVFSSKDKAIAKIKENAKKRITDNLISFIKIKEKIEKSISNIEIVEI